MITSEQRKDRQFGVGGSDMSIIMGLSSYKTPYQLYLEKTGLIEDDIQVSPQQYWGNTLEAVIREEFQKRNNVHVVTPDTIIHPEYDYMRANIDGYIPALNAVLEVKCASSFSSHEWGEEGTDIFPVQHLIQVAYYCAVVNADCGYIAVLIGGNDYREFKYLRDPEIENKILEEAHKFWHCVQSQTPPNAVNQIDLRLMYPKHDPDKTKKIDVNLTENISQLVDTRSKIKKLNEVEEQYKFNVMQFMKDAECLIDDYGKPIVSWKSNKKGSRVFLLKNY